jgi:hypothetical protein
MPRRGLAVALLAVAALNAAAQVTVSDDIVTGEVPLFDAKADNRRSLVAAMSLSLALPGMGHYYVDRPFHALAYLSADMVSLFGAIALAGLAGGYEDNARSFAASAASIGKARSGEAYWRHVGAFMDAAEYNEAVELSRGGNGDLYQDPESWWRWADDAQRGEYNALRQKARNFRVAASFFVGALVANRILSMVDLRVSRKRSLASEVRFEAALAPGSAGAAVAVAMPLK